MKVSKSNSSSNHPKKPEKTLVNLEQSNKMKSILYLTKARLLVLKGNQGVFVVLGNQKQSVTSEFYVKIHRLQRNRRNCERVVEQVTRVKRSCQRNLFLSNMRKLGSVKVSQLRDFKEIMFWKLMKLSKSNSFLNNLKSLRGFGEFGIVVQ